MEEVQPDEPSTISPLSCRARGNPEPVVTWRREDGEGIAVKDASGGRQLGEWEASLIGHLDRCLSVSGTNGECQLCFVSPPQFPLIEERR